MKVLLSTYRVSTNPDTLNWYINSTNPDCFEGPGCATCPLRQNLPTGTACAIFHTMPTAARIEFLQGLLEKHSNQVVELSDMLSDCPELLL